jgi:hypothetical protein
MKRKSTRGLSKEQRKDIAALAAMKESEIDLSDMPEVLDWSGAEIGRFYRYKKRRAEGRRAATARGRPQA